VEEEAERSHTQEGSRRTLYPGPNTNISPPTLVYSFLAPSKERPAAHIHLDLAFTFQRRRFVAFSWDIYTLAVRIVFSTDRTDRKSQFLGIPLLASPYFRSDRKSDKH
jgi:hypothetical protein